MYLHIGVKVIVVQVRVAGVLLARRSGSVDCGCASHSVVVPSSQSDGGEHQRTAFGKKADESRWTSRRRSGKGWLVVYAAPALSVSSAEAVGRGVLGGGVLAAGEASWGSATAGSGAPSDRSPAPGGEAGWGARAPWASSSSPSHASHPSLSSSSRASYASSAVSPSSPSPSVNASREDDSGSSGALVAFALLAAWGGRQVGAAQKQGYTQSGCDMYSNS